MKLSKPLLIIITLLWFILAMWWYSCSTCISCKKEQVITTTDTRTDVASTTSKFLVTDSSWQSTNDANIRFAHGSDIPIIPGAIETNLDSIADHISKNPAKSLSITGYYSATEKNNTSFTNIGIARAESLKKILVLRGVKPIAISTTSQLIDSSLFLKDTLTGGFNMAFNTIKVDAVADTSLFKPYIVYFNTGANSLTIDKPLQDYLQKANQFIQLHTDKKLAVTGYTDNVGKEASNVELSKKRALFVKEQLAAQGIPDSNIVSDGYGSQNPIADNATTDGRSKNRRVTIEIK